MNSMTNPDVYDSVKRWLTKLQAKSRSLDFSKSSTRRAALYWLTKYCKYLKTNPDTLLDNRIKNLESKSEMVKRKHEEHVEEFSIMLQDKKYSPNSIATAIGMIRSFYKANYAQLIEVSTVRPYNVRPFKVPTLRELKKIVKKADTPTKAWILSQKDCGLANIDLMSLRLSTLSSEYGTIKTQLKKDIVPVHIEIRRQKTGERTHSFFGPNSIEALNEYVNLKSRGRIFSSSVRSIQQKVKSIAIRAKVATKEVPVTPYSFRKFFNTQMKFAGMNEALVETMMGHSIGRVRSAYLVTGRGGAASGIPISKLAEEYMKYYHAIDITGA
jgi:integrase